MTLTPGKITTLSNTCKSALTSLALVLFALTCHGESGEIFVANAQTGVIGKYSASGRPLNTNLITGLQAVEGIAIDGDGFLYVTTVDSIRKYTVSGRPIGRKLISGLCSPWAIALDGKGHLFVANYCGSIGEYTTTGDTVNASLIPHTLLLTGLALQDTNMFVSIYGDSPQWIGSIGKFTTSGATISTNFIPDLQWNWGLLINQQGHLFVAKNVPGIISEYDGTNLVNQFDTGMVLTTMAFSADGNILVAADGMNVVGEFTPSGTKVNGALISNLHGARGLAVSLAPSGAVVSEGNQVVATDSSVSFSVTCNGTPPFKYQWFHNSRRIRGASSVLTLQNVSARDAGDYKVRVRNAFGRTMTVPVTLTVTGPAS